MLQVIYNQTLYHHSLMQNYVGIKYITRFICYSYIGFDTIEEDILWMVFPCYNSLNLLNLTWSRKYTSWFIYYKINIT